MGTESSKTDSVTGGRSKNTTKGMVSDFVSPSKGRVYNKTQTLEDPRGNSNNVNLLPQSRPLNAHN